LKTLNGKKEKIDASACLRGSDNLNDVVNDAWVLESRGISKLVLLARKNLAKNSSHNLAGSSLWKVFNDEDSLWSSKWTNLLADLENELLASLWRVLGNILEGDKGVDGLSGELIRDTNNSSFGDVLVSKEGSLNLSGGQSVTGNVDNIVNTATNPVVTLMITSGTIPSEVISVIDIEIGVEEALVGSPNGTGHRWPWLLDGKNTLDVVALDLLSGDRINDSWRDTEEWKGSGSWLGWGNTSEWGDDVGTGLGLPVSLNIVVSYGQSEGTVNRTYIDNVALLVTDLSVVPLPDLLGNWFTD
jgi:hypothetical protein